LEPQDCKASGMDGQISSLSSGGNGFSMVTSDGAKLSLNTSSSTVYQGVDLASVRDCSPAKLVVSGSCAGVAAASRAAS
jgi:hypothetical protein